MLIDEFLPEYDERERHSLTIRAPVAKVYQTARQMKFQKSRLINFLFRLRGIQSSAEFSREDFLKMRFVVLGEKPNEEILFGLTGKFWKPNGDLIRVEKDDFVRFDKPGYAKAAWNFSLDKTGDNAIRLNTETRVFCTDATSRQQFRFYWFFIGWFSGLIRREMLSAIKQAAENSCSHAGRTPPETFGNQI